VNVRLASGGRYGVKEKQTGRTDMWFYDLLLRVWPY